MGLLPCKACRARGKTWKGDDPTCAFLSGWFSDDNWSCATAGLIRDICYEGQKPRLGVDYQYCDDQKYATINIDHIESIGALALWVTWYKKRGATDGMWLLFSDGPPRKPNEDECVAIVASFAQSGMDAA